MGTDQGKTSNVAGIGILSEKISKEIPSIGTTTFRMPHTPITFGVIGGKDIKNLFDPIRLTKIDPGIEKIKRSLNMWVNGCEPGITLDKMKTCKTQ